MRVLRGWSAADGDARVDWFYANGWYEVEADEVDPDLADWALPERAWPGSVRSRFDGRARDREATVQTWTIHRRIGSLPLTRSLRREVIALEADAALQPLILRPRATLNRSAEPVWPGAAEVQSRDVLIAGSSAAIRYALPLLAQTLHRVAKSGAMATASSGRVVISAPVEASPPVLSSRLELAAELAERLEQGRP